MFSLTDGEALEVFRGGLVTMFVVAVANKTLTTAQTYGLSATAAECRRRQPGPRRLQVAHCTDPGSPRHRAACCGHLLTADQSASRCAGRRGLGRRRAARYDPWE